ncbi:MAG: hypothetical protein ACPGWR_25170 [Ardenticatenaceae bacterium]
MSNNPFTFGSMTDEPNKFVGRRAELELITARLNGNPPQGSAIVGERRIGKSSLLHYLVHPRDDESLLPRDTMRVVYLSAAAGHCNTPEQFRMTLIETLLKQSKLEKRTKEGKWLDQLKNKLANHEPCSWGTAREALKKMPFHPVICLDEFGALLTDHFDERFFNALRTWANEGLLSWVTGSAKPLQELGHEKDLTSPFFNLLAIVPLAGLTDDEVGQLLKLADTTSHPFSEKEKRMVKRLAGKNPYHLQVVAWRLWEMKDGEQREEMKAKAKAKEKALRHYLCQQPNPPALCSKTRYPPVSWLIIGVLLIIIIFLLGQAPHLVEPVLNSIKLWFKSGWKLFNEHGTACGMVMLLLGFITIVLRVIKEKRGVLESLLEIWDRFIRGN